MSKTIAPDLLNEAEIAIREYGEARFNGGNNVLGDGGQFNAPTVIAGDLQSLRESLEVIGIGRRSITKLEDALLLDKMAAMPKAPDAAVGPTTMGWIKTAAKKVGGAGLKVGGAVAEEAIKRAILSYPGI